MVSIESVYTRKRRIPYSIFYVNELEYSYGESVTVIMKNIVKKIKTIL